MTRTNLEALTHQQRKHPAHQPPAKPPPGEARRAPKKPRSSPGTDRAPKKGALPARRASAAAGAGASDEKGRGDGAGEGAKGSALWAELAGTSEGAAAFARVQPELDALPDDALRRFTVNVPNAVVLVLGAWPKMQKLRDAMRATFVDPPFASLDNLRDYALAAAYAHARALPHDEGETRVRALLNEATPLRARLLSSAETLATFGLLDPRKIAAVRQGTGHVDTAQDLSALVALLREAGPDVIAKTPLTLADLTRAGALGSLLLEALGHRRSGADGAGKPLEADERLAQAYALMARAYETCRRAIAFLRWSEGDADDIAPPLGRSRRRGRRSPSDEPDGGETDPPAPNPDEPAVGEPLGGEVDGG